MGAGDVVEARADRRGGVCIELGEAIGMPAHADQVSLTCGGHDPQRQLPELAAKGQAANDLPHRGTSTRSSGERLCGMEGQRGS
jgi:hypothetical protein